MNKDEYIKKFIQYVQEKGNIKDKGKIMYSHSVFQGPQANGPLVMVTSGLLAESARS